MGRHYEHRTTDVPLGRLYTAPSDKMGPAKEAEGREAGEG